MSTTFETTRPPDARPAAVAPEAMEAVLALFAREGYQRAEPAVLQPADVFLDLSGEDIRRRLFVTAAADGQELCLRPEYTIPVCRYYLEREKAGDAAAYSYLGPVFRLSAADTGEHPQAGIESFGREDREAADAEIFGLALEAVAQLGLADPVVTVADMAVLDALVDRLRVDGPTKRRLLRAVAAGADVSAFDAAEPGNGKAAEYAGLLAAIEGQDPKAARAFVEDVLTIAGISRVGGRTAGEIAERFLARAERRAGGLGGEARAVLDRYLSLSGDPDTVALALRGLATEASLDLDAAIDAFEARTGFIAARGIDVNRINFSARFARNLDYYTGFIFDIDDPRRADRKPVAGGGRYDGLLAHLGAQAPVPAVGCAIWLDRFDPPQASAGGRP